MNKRKLYTYPVIFCFMAFITAVLVLFLWTAPKSYNDNEEKQLGQHPRIYESASFDEFTTAFDAYASDQFPVRDLIIGTKNEAELSSGSDTIAKDVYILSSDYLFSYTYATANWMPEALAKLIKAKQASTDLDYVYTLLPQKNMLLADSEPSINPATDEANKAKTISHLENAGISYIDCCEFMKACELKERAHFFYKTDLHWNAYGAFTASKHIADSLANMGLIKRYSVPNSNDFVWDDLTGRDYLGDLQKRFSSEVTVQEYIPLYSAVDADSFKYFTGLNSEEVPRETIVASGIEDEVLNYNKLSTYNLGYLRVENENAKEDRHVLILKDSYACTMIEYFSELFTEIDIVDPRMASPSFDEIVAARDIDMVLFLYHANNISSELIKYFK